MLEQVQQFLDFYEKDINMSDKLKIPTRQDAERINVHQDLEVRYWCKELDCTVQQLEAAVDKVGVIAVDVRRYLAKGPANPFATNLQIKPKG